MTSAQTFWKQVEYEEVAGYFKHKQSHFSTKVFSWEREQRRAQIQKRKCHRSLASKIVLLEVSVRLDGIAATGPLSSQRAWTTHLETNLNFHSQKYTIGDLSVFTAVCTRSVNGYMSLLLYNQEAPLLYHMNAVRMLVKCGLCCLESLPCILWNYQSMQSTTV